MRLQRHCLVRFDLHAELTVLIVEAGNALLEALGDAVGLALDLFLQALQFPLQCNASGMALAEIKRSLR